MIVNSNKYLKSVNSNLNRKIILYKKQIKEILVKRTDAFLIGNKNKVSIARPIAYCNIL